MKFVCFYLGRVTVEFSNSTYSGSESNGNIAISLLFTKGISTSAIIVEVKFTNQSAQGKRCVP